MKANKPTIRKAESADFDQVYPLLKKWTIVSLHGKTGKTCLKIIGNWKSFLHCDYFLVTHKNDYCLIMGKKEGNRFVFYTVTNKVFLQTHLLKQKS